jgi:hypothetical protein
MIATKDLRAGSRTKWHPLTARLNIPKSCKLQGGLLDFQWRCNDGLSASRHPEPSKAPPDLWKKFISLTADDEIRSFAARYGPLLVSERHGEPISDWRTFIGLANALWGGSVAVRDGVRCKSEFRDILTGWCFGASVHVKHPAINDGSGMFKGSRHKLKTLLAMGLSKWLREDGCYSPDVSWRGDSFEVKPASFGVLGAVGLQLASAMTRSDLGQPCDACGRPTAPSPRATKGKRRYCGQCIESGEARKHSMRETMRERRGHSKT